MKRLFFVLVAIILLAGCATPSGQLSKDDFNWTILETKLNYQEAYRRMHKGINSERMYITEGNLYSELGRGMIDIYISAFPFNIRSPYVYGRINVVKKSGSQTIVEAGLNNAFPDGDGVRKKWLNNLEIATD